MPEDPTNDAAFGPSTDTTAASLHERGFPDPNGPAHTEPTVGGISDREVYAATGGREFVPEPPRPSVAFGVHRPSDRRRVRNEAALNRGVVTVLEDYAPPVREVAG